MKQINIIITILVVCLLFSCHKDDCFEDDNAGNAMLSIKFNIINNEIASRAVSSDEDEKKIFNAYVFIFNSKGEKVYSKFTGGLANYETLAIDEITDVLGGSNMTVAVIVNIDNGIMSTTMATLDAIATKGALQESVATITGEYTGRGTSFLMSGCLENISLTGKTNTVEIPLRRVDAKIRFNIRTFVHPTDPSKSVTFAPTEWRIVSLPKKVYVLSDPTKKSTFAGDKSNYFTTNWKNYEPVSPALEAEGVKTTFAFYAMESLLDAKKAIPTTGLDNYQRYALRDKQLKNSDGKNKAEFEYANDVGTYVELKGNIKYRESSITEISADVKFMIHLGGGVSDVDNYSTVRNTNYIYNITINSINEIYAEVVDDNEKRPGIEGDIVFANIIKEFDAYNNVFTMPFVLVNVDDSLTWDVSTPFSKGEAGQNPKDFKWVYFRRGVVDGNENYVDGFNAYLGDQNVYTDVTTTDEQASALLDKYLADIGTPNEKMLNVDQLVEVLKESKRRISAGGKSLFDESGTAMFTTFILDYYYESNPDTGEIKKDLWKKFADADKRVLNIMSDYQVSADGNSTKSVAQFLIRQASIQTVYSTTTKEVISAFGSQFYPNAAMTNTEFAKTGETTTTNNDKANGRKNYANFFTVGVSKWDTYINIDNWTLKADYDYVKYRSLLHNRDTNGDGIIDANEIQWYLASIDQLSILWIGEEALHPTSKLYQLPTWMDTRQHYVSSSLLEVSNPQVLWAAEGSSVGPFLSAKKDLLYYRTVRNLGIPKVTDTDTDTYVMPDNVYIYHRPNLVQERSYSFGDWETVDFENGEIDLSRLNSKALRDFAETDELPDHGLRDERGYNKPYRKFKINAKTSGVNLTWENVRARSQPGVTNNRVAPAGWRVPNQRELSLMYIAMSLYNSNPGAGWSVHKRDYFNPWPLPDQFTRTGFNLDWTSDRPGFSATKDGSRFRMISTIGDGDGGVRSVQDVVAP